MDIHKSLIERVKASRVKHLTKDIEALIEQFIEVVIKEAIDLYRKEEIAKRLVEAYKSEVDLNQQRAIVTVAERLLGKDFKDFWNEARKP